MALTQTRHVWRASHPFPVQTKLPVKASTTLWGGEFLGKDNNGFIRAATAADTVAVGILEDDVDPQATDGAVYANVIVSARIFVPIASFDPANAYNGADDHNKVVYYDTALNRFTTVAVDTLDVGKVDSYDPDPKQPGFWVNFRGAAAR